MTVLIYLHEIYLMLNHAPSLRLYTHIIRLYCCSVNETKMSLVYMLVSVVDRTMDQTYKQKFAAMR